MFKAIKLLSAFALLASTEAMIHDNSKANMSEKRLIELQDHTQIWVTEQQKFDLRVAGKHFMDITDYQSITTFDKAPAKNFPKTTKSQSQVKDILKKLSIEAVKANLADMTSYDTRYYKSPIGQQSQKWLLNKVTEVTGKLASSSLKEHIEISEFKHPWGQNSILAKIKGTDESLGHIIISAHQDSISGGSTAPGADDDASGSISILEAYRAIIASGKRFARTVEFHWYSAEEAGLLGSQAVANDYAERKVDVVAQIQFDMTAWVKKGTKEAIGIFTDYINSDLTAFNKVLVKEYLDIGIVETQCGYACSDHGSWNRAGYASSFVGEGKFSDFNFGNIHTEHDRSDVSDEFSFTHMVEFSKLAVGWVVELGNWTGK